LPYGRGISPDELRLGSLYLDPHNPNVGLEKLRFEYKEKMYEIFLLANVSIHDDSMAKR
jgi:hypothetical protein